jgi:hypothetical protein
MPVDNTGASSDGGAALGSSSIRFSDLYLSGGVYLGGTGAANKLDDYEEGTWVPTVTMDSGTSTVSAYGKYVKTGQTVYATFYIQFTAAASTPVVGGITNFPFVHENSGTWAGVGSVRENSQTGYQWHARMNNNATEALLRSYDNSGAVAVNYTFIGSVTYTTP